MKLTSIVCYILYLNILFYIGVQPVTGEENSTTLEKKTATHSSILAWRIPWTEESGGLQSMGSQSRT